MKRRSEPAFRLPVSPDQVVRHALAAYYRAVGDCTAPRGDPDPAAWSDPDFFIETLADFFQLRLRCDAANAGHPVAADHDRLAARASQPVSADLHIRDVDPGLWAEVVDVDSVPGGVQT